MDKKQSLHKRHAEKQIAHNTSKGESRNHSSKCLISLPTAHAGWRIGRPLPYRICYADADSCRFSHELRVRARMAGTGASLGSNQGQRV